MNVLMQWLLCNFNILLDTCICYIVSYVKVWRKYGTGY